MENLKKYRAQNSKGIISFVVLLTITAPLIYLSLSGNFLIYAVAQICLSIIMWSWFAVLHSCGHLAYTKSKKLNFILGHLSSLIVFVPFFSWKYHHDQHHKWTGWKEKDPSANELSDDPPNQKTLNFLNFCWKYWIPIFSISHTLTNFWNPIRMKELLGPGEKNIRSLISQVILVCYIGAFLFFNPIVFLKVYGLAIILFLITGDLVLLSQHSLLPPKNVNEIQVKPFKNHEAFTRTITFHPVIDRFVFLNFNLHSVHHAYPSIPHYHLDKIHYKAENTVSITEWIKLTKVMDMKDFFWPNSCELKEGSNV